MAKNKKKARRPRPRPRPRAPRRFLRGVVRDVIRDHMEAHPDVSRAELSAMIEDDLRSEYGSFTVWLKLILELLKVFLPLFLNERDP